jgi:hypothetical protein
MLKKYGLGYILGIFSKKSSGHPAQCSVQILSDIKSNKKAIKRIASEPSSHFLLKVS